MLLALFTLLRMKKNIASSKESSADSVCLFYSVFVITKHQYNNLDIAKYLSPLC